MGRVQQVGDRPDLVMGCRNHRPRVFDHALRRRAVGQHMTELGHSQADGGQVL